MSSLHLLIRRKHLLAVDLDWAGSADIAAVDAELAANAEALGLGRWRSIVDGALRGLSFLESSNYSPLPRQLIWPLVGLVIAVLAYALSREFGSMAWWFVGIVPCSFVAAIVGGVVHTGWLALFGAGRLARGTAALVVGAAATLIAAVPVLWALGVPVSSAAPYAAGIGALGGMTLGGFDAMFGA